MKHSLNELAKKQVVWNGGNRRKWIKESSDLQNASERMAFWMSGVNVIRDVNSLSCFCSAVQKQRISGIPCEKNARVCRLWRAPCCKSAAEWIRAVAIKREKAECAGRVTLNKRKKPKMTIIVYIIAHIDAVACLRMRFAELFATTPSLAQVAVRTFPTLHTLFRRIQRDTIPSSTLPTLIFSKWKTAVRQQVLMQ